MGQWSQTDAVLPPCSAFVAEYLQVTIPLAHIGPMHAAGLTYYPVPLTAVRRPAETAALYTWPVPQ